MRYWKKLSGNEIQERIFSALENNINFKKQPVFGIPGSHLDPEIFHENLPFLKEAPFLSSLIANPNHIGCHTLNESELHFEGTQSIERELIGICAEDIMEAEPDSVDGYVASGGTEANIEAVWIYRNYFRNEFRATHNEIGLFFSADSHYSMNKSADLLGLKSFIFPVYQNTRLPIPDLFNELVDQATSEGIKYFILVLNCGTTMFGSTDDTYPIIDILTKKNLIFRLHIDAAFGGFIYPFTKPDNAFTFKNPCISSITMDAHKLLQTPYGTGIFLIRKNLIKNVCTSSASYVYGNDHTLCGSRSGANAVAAWMVLQNYGPERWKSKMITLNEKTNRICEQLTALGIKFYRNPGMNIITIPYGNIDEKTAKEYRLVADTWKGKQKWWKIVVMDHVTDELIHNFIEELRNKNKHDLIKE